MGKSLFSFLIYEAIAVNKVVLPAPGSPTIAIRLFFPAGF